MKKYIYASLFFACLTMCFADVATAQRGRNNELMNLLRNENIKKELELVDDQVEEIESIMEEMWTEMREKMSSMRDMRELSPEDRRERYAEIRKEMDERRGEYQTRVDGVLLPNQISRLKQLNVQSRARRNGQGTLGVLQNKELLDELGIDEATQEKLAKKAEEVLEELKKKIAKLRKQAEEEILSVLPSEQRKKYRDAVGEAFEFERARGGTQQAGPGGAAQERGVRGRQQADDK